MAIREERKQDTIDSLIKAGNAFMQTPKGTEFIQKVDKTRGQIRTLKETQELIRVLKTKITGYKIKGIVYDEQTQEPVDDAEIKVLTAVTPVEKIQVVEKIKVPDPEGRKNFIGQVKKVEQEVLVDKWIKKENPTPSEKTIKTNKKGEYEFTFGVPTIEFDGVVKTPLLPSILIEKKGYAPSVKALTTSDGSVLRTQVPIALINIKEAADLAVTKVILEAQKAANKAVEKLLSPIELVINKLRGRIMSFANVIQSRLFPLALQLMIIFGITKLAKDNVENAKCPSDALLKECIRRRNSIVRQLNQIYVVIATNTALAIVFEILTRNFEFVIKAVDNLSFPVAVPPGIGVPQSILAQLESLKELFRDLGDLNKELRRSLLISLIFLVISLIIILRYLKRLDALIEKCAADTSDMEEISAELLALSELETAQGTPELKVVNNFIMSAEKVKDSEVDGLFRRQAIAKNSQGVILLRGEPSFSATDQVLIDELAFYIVQNNLKAD